MGEQKSTQREKLSHTYNNGKSDTHARTQSDRARGERETKTHREKNTLIQTDPHEFRHKADAELDTKPRRKNKYTQNEKHKQTKSDTQTGRQTGMKRETKLHRGKNTYLQRQEAKKRHTQSDTQAKRERQNTQEKNTHPATQRMTQMHTHTNSQT